MLKSNTGVMDTQSGEIKWTGEGEVAEKVEFLVEKGEMKATFWPDPGPMTSVKELLDSLKPLRERVLSPRGTLEILTKGKMVCFKYGVPRQEDGREVQDVTRTVLEGNVVILAGDRIRPIRAIEKKRLKAAMRQKIARREPCLRIPLSSVR